jgi:hypothetical protein
MHIKSSKPKKAERKHMFFYIVLSILILISKTVVLALSDWFVYCWWVFGLMYGSSFTNFTNFNNEATIIDVKSDSCGSIKSLVEEYCPKFCENITDFENAGITMMVFGVFSILAEVLCLSFHLCKYNKNSFRFEKI